jgi:hypothetical protein
MRSSITDVRSKILVVFLTCLLAASLVGSVSAAGTAWHSMRVRNLGHRVGKAWGAAVNDSGTSLVTFDSKSTLTIARRSTDASKFKVSARLSADNPEVIDLTALADGQFLLIYTTKRGLLARGIDGAGHFRGSAHVLTSGPIAFVSLPLVTVESDASRTVVVWGLNDKTTDSIRGAIDDQAGWSSAQLLYSLKSAKTGPFFLQAVSDSEDRFLVSLQGTLTANPASVMWGVPQGSRQWEPVTPPQTTDNSALAEENGTTLASVNGVITGAWQDSSGALVVSTSDGSTWTTPVTAIAGSQSSHGGPAVIYPRFVSDGSRTAIVWPDESQTLFGPLKATIRASSGGSWSPPLTFPHSRNDPNSYQETFWFAPSGALAGIWSDSNFPKLASPPTLYAGTVSGNAASATALGKTQNPLSARSWFVLPHAAGLRTVVWPDAKDREFSTTVTATGSPQQKQSVPACAAPIVGASNPAASAQVVAVAPIGHNPATSGPKCPALLLW